MRTTHPERKRWKMKYVTNQNRSQRSRKDTTQQISVSHFNDGGPNHIETSQLICSANQWTGFYMIETSVMKELIPFQANFLFLYPFKTSENVWVKVKNVKTLSVLV